MPSAVVALIGGDYSPGMVKVAHASDFRIESRGPAGRLVMRGATPDGAELVVIAGFRGPALPDVLTKPTLAETSAGQWRLSSSEGIFEFAARGVDRIALRPALYEPLHARFALSRADRVAVRVLLRMLRFPGGTRILRWWQLLR
jgi:hypothetical protein